MASRANKPVSVTLGQLGERAEARVRSGDYASISEVLRAGLRALDREDALLERLFPPIDENDPDWIAHVREKIAEARAETRPPMSSEEAFARLDEHIAARRASVAHKIVFGEAALADLKSFFDYLDDVAGFDTAVENDARVRATCLSLADFPNRGSPRGEIEPGLRSLPCARSATIFYTVEADQVWIVRVIHARRDAGAAFKEPQ